MHRGRLLNFSKFIMGSARRMSTASSEEGFFHSLTNKIEIPTWGLFLAGMATVGYGGRWLHDDIDSAKKELRGDLRILNQNLFNIGMRIGAEVKNIEDASDKKGQTNSKPPGS